MKTLIIRSIFIVLCILSCSNPNVGKVEDIDALIKGHSPDSLIQGFFLVGKHKKVEYIPLIFNNIDDPRITHDLYFKGMSVYQSKVSALRQISGLEPPKKITYKPDTVIINFYFKWAKERGYL